MEESASPEECIGLPDEETISCIDGLVENHHYVDLRGDDLETAPLSVDWSCDFSIGPVD
jgi:hypothetical protein